MHRALLWWESTDIHVDRGRNGWHENKSNSSRRGGKELASMWVTVVIMLKSVGEESSRANGVDLKRFKVLPGGISSLPGTGGLEGPPRI